MIDTLKLKEVMQFIVKEYPNCPAISRWKTDGYIDIAEEKRDFNDADDDDDIEYIIYESLDTFKYEDLKLCGSGSPEKTLEVLRLILLAQSKDSWDSQVIAFNDICKLNIQKNTNYDGLIQFVLYVLDSHGFLSHGRSIGCAYLTQKGKLFLDLLNMNHELESSES